MTALDYADADAALGRWVSLALGVPVATETPANLEKRLPFIRLRRVGGTDPELTLDQVVVAVDAFHDDGPSASALASRVRTLLRHRSRGVQLAGCRVGLVGTVTAPIWAAWDDTSLRRYTATYRVTVHQS